VRNQGRLKKTLKVSSEKRFTEKSNIKVRLDNVQFTSINREDNVSLISRFSEDEIKEAIWDCDSSKSLGPYGFNFNFIKQFWDTVKLDIIRAVNSFHSCGKLAKGSNASFITLIPKTEDPQGLEEYRPISLVGSVYKIISKIL